MYTEVSCFCTEGVCAQEKFLAFAQRCALCVHSFVCAQRCVLYVHRRSVLFLHRGVCYVCVSCLCREVCVMCACLVCVERCECV